MGQSSVRVHQVFEGLHEQQGRTKGHVRAQGGLDTSRPVHYANPGKHFIIDLGKL
jgi:hypothetical protein